MSIKDMPLVELELLSYSDIAYQIIKEEATPMTTADVFKLVCKLRKIKKAGFEAKIADFFTVLTTDKRFVLLENGAWDLKERHTAKVEIEQIIEDEMIDEIEEEAEETTELDKDIELLVDINEDEFEDEETTELEDLVIISEDDLEED